MTTPARKKAAAPRTVSAKRKPAPPVSPSATADPSPAAPVEPAAALQGFIDSPATMQALRAAADCFAEIKITADRAFEAAAPALAKWNEELEAAADQLAKTGIAASEPLRAAAKQAAAKVAELQKRYPSLSTEAAILVALAPSPSAPPPNPSRISPATAPVPAEPPALLSSRPACAILREDCTEWEERATALEDYADILAFAVECETFTAENLRDPETVNFLDLLQSNDRPAHLFKRGGASQFEIELESGVYGLDPRPGLFSAGLISRPFAWPGWRWNQRGLTFPAGFDLSAELKKLRNGAAEIRRLEREESDEWKPEAEAAEEYRAVKGAILRRYYAALEEIRTLRKKVRGFCTSRQVEGEKARAAAALQNRFPDELPPAPPSAEPFAAPVTPRTTAKQKSERKKREQIPEPWKRAVEAFMNDECDRWPASDSALWGMFTHWRNLLNKGKTREYAMTVPDSSALRRARDSVRHRPRPE